jgi:hypothetical protein
LILQDRLPRPPKRLFTEASLGELYALPATWDQYDSKVDLTLSADDPFCGMTLTEDEASSLCHDGIRAPFVKDGHKTPDSLTSSFAGVVSRDSIRITLTHAALLGLPILGADIRNAYLQAPSSEKHYIICGLEFGIENEGRVGLIRRALLLDFPYVRTYESYICNLASF